MKTAQKRLEEIKEHGYEFDFTVTFNHAIEMYKKTALVSGLAYLIVFSLLSAIVLGIVFNIIDIRDQESVRQMQNFQLQQLSPTGLLLYVLATIGFSALFAPFSAGLIKMCNDAEMNRPVSIGTAFHYYKAPYFLQLIVATVLISIVSLGLNAALEYMGIPIVGALISLLIGITTCMTIPLIIFGNLSASEAIQGSVVIISKHPITILGLVIIGSLVALLGIIGCCVGIIFTLPLINAVYYSIYVHSVGIEENRGIEEYN